MRSDDGDAVALITSHLLNGGTRGNDANDDHLRTFLLLLLHHGTHVFDSQILGALALQAALGLEGGCRGLYFFSKTVGIFDHATNENVVVPCSSVAGVLFCPIGQFLYEDVLSISMFSIILHCSLVDMFLLRNLHSAVDAQLVVGLSLPFIDHFLGLALLLLEDDE